MNGVAVQLLADATGAPSLWFGKVFKPVLPKLDELHWYPANGQPWMGPPPHFDETGEVWRRGALGRYWRHFAEEYLDLWGFTSSAVPEVSASGASAILNYTDGTCWELYTELPNVVEQVYLHADKNKDLRPARAHFQRRGEAFGYLGLSDVWRRIRNEA